ncbi:hypothetical protein HDU97_009288 [Phlyctochytrium planicorne]|nr:hypothetical protein HDU97_009288 [Phlyctochytrium planicorne]
MFTKFALFAAIAAISRSAVAAPVSAFEYPFGSASDVSIVSTESQFNEISGSHGIYYGDYTVVVNLAEVGVRFTNDSWSHQYEAFGSYKDKINNEFELWTVSIPRGKYYTSDPKPEYEIAGFASFDASPRVWDPQNNKFVYYKATPKTPLAFINDGLSYDNSTKKVILTGSARTYSANRAADYKSGNVVVRWTVDNWTTSQDALASPPVNPATDAWTWNIAVSGTDSFPETVQYAVVYKAVSPEFWINNSGQNYVKHIKPQFFKSELAGQTLSGVNNFYYNVYSDLPVAPFAVAIDGKATSYLNSTVIETIKLGNGDHKLDISVSLLNGPVIQSESLAFSVSNKFQPKSSWTKASLPGSDAQFTFSDSAAIRKDKIYVGLSNGAVAKFDTVGASTFSSFYNVSGTSGYSPVSSIAVDDEAVYALSNSKIYKFNEKTAKAAAGFSTINVDYQTNIDGKPVCYATSIAAAADGVFLADSCNRVLKFSAATGNFVGSVTVDDSIRPSTLAVDGSDVIVGYYRFDGGFTINRINAAANTLVADSTITYANAGSVQAMAVVDGKYAVIRNGDTISYLAKDGTVEANWTGRGGDKNVLGNMSNGKAILPLSDGTFLTSDYSVPNFQKFSQKLL